MHKFVDVNSFGCTWICGLCQIFSDFKLYALRNPYGWKGYNGIFTDWTLTMKEETISGIKLSVSSDSKINMIFIVRISLHQKYQTRDRFNRSKEWDFSRVESSGLIKGPRLETKKAWYPMKETVRSRGSFTKKYHVRISNLDMTIFSNYYKANVPNSF